MDAVNNNYRQLLERMARSPLWAILPGSFTALVFDALCKDQATALKTQTLGKGQNRITIIPVQGILTSDGPGWLGSNYGNISDAAEQAAADPSVKRIVLSVDSPGGEVTGLPETAAVLAQVAKVKPVSAVVEGMSASAAYWLTSQAQDIALTPSGEVGSVGVRMMHLDVSKALDEAGIKVTELQAGQFKTEWSPYKPLSEEAKADMQARLDSTHQDFINAVSSGRGARVSAEMKDGRFGEGRMLSAVAALNHGLVDKIQAPREFYRAIMPPAEEVPAPAPKFGLQAQAEAKVKTAKSRAR